MKTVTKNLTLVSSKLKKYDHDLNEYVYVEDETQQHRLNQKVEASFYTVDGVKVLHSFEGPALGKEYYINGVKYSKTSWMDVIRLMKKEETLKNN